MIKIFIIFIREYSNNDIHKVVCVKRGRARGGTSTPGGVTGGRGRGR